MVLALVGVPVRAQTARTLAIGGCGAPVTDSAQQTHVIYWGSEGTAWPTTWVWVSMLNPTDQPQTVRVRIDPDMPEPVTVLSRTFTLAARNRYAININEWLASVGLFEPQNFATEVKFGTIGVATLATWVRDYSRVVYTPLVQGCDAPVLTNPYRAVQ